MRWQYDKSFDYRTGYCPYQAAFDSPQAAVSEVIEGDSLLLKPFGTSKIGVVCSKNQSLLKYNDSWKMAARYAGGFWVFGLSESKMLGHFQRTGRALQSASVLPTGGRYAVR